MSRNNGSGQEGSFEHQYILLEESMGNSFQMTVTSKCAKDAFNNSSVSLVLTCFE